MHIRTCGAVNFCPKSGNKTSWEIHFPKGIQAIQHIAHPVYCCGDPPSESMKNCTKSEEKENIEPRRQIIEQYNLEACKW